MNERPAVNRLREAMQRASIDDLDDVAEEIGQQAVAVALEKADATPPAVVERHKPDEAVRMQLYDESLRDTDEIVRRHRERLGRRVCTTHDASVIRRVHQLLRGMADANGGADNDPSFQ